MPDVVGSGGGGFGDGGRHERLEDHRHLGHVVLRDGLESGGEGAKGAHVATPAAAAAAAALITYMNE